MTLWTWFLTFLLAAQGGEATGQATAAVPAPIHPQVSSMRLRNTARPNVVVLWARIECGQEGVELLHDGTRQASVVLVQAESEHRYRSPSKAPVHALRPFITYRPATCPSRP